MRIAILGTKTTCLRLIEALGDRVIAVATLDDRTDPRSRLSDITTYGATAGIKTVVAASPAAAYEALSLEAPDVVFVAGWYHWIAPTVLDGPPHGFVGVHYSALPAYRGSSPLVWALINGEREVGYSLFRFTEGLDEGPLAAQGLVSVETGDDVAKVLDRLDERSTRAFVQFADEIADGHANLVPQREEGASYAGARRPADGAIDWSWTAERIARFVRAQSRPYPGAFSTLDGETIRIWAARDLDEPHFGIPGQVIRTIGGDPVVACGDGTGLVLTEIEAATTPRFSVVRSRFGQTSSA